MLDRLVYRFGAASSALTCCRFCSINIFHLNSHSQRLHTTINILAALNMNAHWILAVVLASPQTNQFSIGISSGHCHRRRHTAHTHTNFIIINGFRFFRFFVFYNSFFSYCMEVRVVDMCHLERPHTENVVFFCFFLLFHSCVRSVRTAHASTLHVSTHTHVRSGDRWENNASINFELKQSFRFHARAQMCWIVDAGQVYGMIYNCIEWIRLFCDRWSMHRTSSKPQCTHSTHTHHSRMRTCALSVKKISYGLIDLWLTANRHILPPAKSNTISN